MPITKKDFKNALKEFNRIEDRGEFWYRARNLLLAGYEVEAYVLILATWNFAGFRYLVKDFDIKNKVLNDVIMHQHDLKNDLVLKVSARKIFWNKQNEWEGEGVVLYKMNKKGEFIGEPFISQSINIPIVETPTDFINNQWKPEYMSYKQLKNYMNIFATGSQKTYRRFQVDLNYKIAFPYKFYNFV